MQVILIHPHSQLPQAATAVHGGRRCKIQQCPRRIWGTPGHSPGTAALSTLYQRPAQEHQLSGTPLRR